VNKLNNLEITATLRFRWLAIGCFYCTRDIPIHCRDLSSRCGNEHWRAILSQPFPCLVQRVRKWNGPSFTASFSRFVKAPTLIWAEPSPNEFALTSPPSKCLIKSQYLSFRIFGFECKRDVENHSNNSRYWGSILSHSGTEVTAKVYRTRSTLRLIDGPEFDSEIEQL